MQVHVEQRSNHTVVRLQIRGLVQGVGYLWSLVEQAKRLGVRGWVRNRRDGSVECLAAGERDAVDRLVAWAHHGPSGAVVASVEICEADGDCIGFEQLPTE